MNLVYFRRFCVSYPKDPYISLIGYVVHKCTQWNLVWKISHFLAYKYYVLVRDMKAFKWTVNVILSGRSFICWHVRYPFNILLMEVFLVLEFERVSL